MREGGWDRRCLRRPGRDDVVTRWDVVQEDGFPGVWSVQRIDQDGTVTYPRNRWRGISCIDAQVIAAELNNAHRLGGIEAIETMRRQVFDD